MKLNKLITIALLAIGLSLPALAQMDVTPETPATTSVESRPAQGADVTPGTSSTGFREVMPAQPPVPPERARPVQFPPIPSAPQGVQNGTAPGTVGGTYDQLKSQVMSEPVRLLNAQEQAVKQTRVARNRGHLANVNRQLRSAGPSLRAQLLQAKKDLVNRIAVDEESIRELQAQVARHNAAIATLQKVSQIHGKMLWRHDGEIKDLQNRVTQLEQGPVTGNGIGNNTSASASLPVSSTTAGTPVSGAGNTMQQLMTPEQVTGLLFLLGLGFLGFVGLIGIGALAFYIGRRNRARVDHDLPANPQAWRDHLTDTVKDNPQFTNMTVEVTRGRFDQSGRYVGRDTITASKP